MRNDTTACSFARGEAAGGPRGDRKMPICEKCGTEFEAGLAACPKCGPEEKPATPGAKPAMSPLDSWQLMFLILAVLPGFFHLVNPAENMKQLVFRLSIAGVGLLGLIVVTILKFRRGRS